MGFHVSLAEDRVLSWRCRVAINPTRTFERSFFCLDSVWFLGQHSFYEPRRYNIGRFKSRFPQTEGHHFEDPVLRVMVNKARTRVPYLRNYRVNPQPDYREPGSCSL